MSDWRKIVISPDTPILEAIRIIDEGSMQIAVVADDGGRLRGTVTDGDIRRGILKGVSLDSPVERVMNRDPIIAHPGDGQERITGVMMLRDIRNIPLVDSEGQLVGLEVLRELVRAQDRQNWVVLMAGGKGSRLRPLTDDRPKPMLPVGNRPILEMILENLKAHGFRNFFLSVDYKAEVVMDHFGDGSRWGINITYLQEKKPLGTAGPLGILPESPSEPILVMNGDLLTKVNFQQLLDFHQECRSQATMCVREYTIQVPFGVATIRHQHLVKIEEKPEQRIFVNAGIYILEPDILREIPKNVRLEMPDLFKTLLEKGIEPVAFPIREYWLDIGRMDDLKQAKDEYSKVFE